MPIYEYKCQDCHKTFEVMQKLNDPALTACIHCLGRISKIISPSGLVFKGSGWYVTDYSSKGKEVKSPSPGETKPTPAPGKKTEEKKAEDKKPASGDK